MGGHKERAENPAGGTSRTSRRGNHSRKRSYDFYTPLRRTTKGKLGGCTFCMPGSVAAVCLEKAELRRVERCLQTGDDNFHL